MKGRLSLLNFRLLKKIVKENLGGYFLIHPYPYLSFVNLYFPIITEIRL